MRYVLNLAMPVACTCAGLLILAVLSSLSGKGGMLQALGEMANTAFPFVAVATLFRCLGLLSVLPDCTLGKRGKDWRLPPVRRGYVAARWKIRPLR